MRSSATIQPMRSPGASAFDALPSVITMPVSSNDLSVCGVSPSKMRSWYAQSSMIGNRFATHEAMSARRRGSLIVTPVGLWLVGIVYSTASFSRVALARGGSEVCGADGTAAVIPSHCDPPPISLPSASTSRPCSSIGTPASFMPADWNTCSDLM